MGIIGSISGALGLSKDINIEEFMDAAEAEDVDIMHKQADFYVKPIAFQNENDINVVKEELTAKNIVLLNIAPIAKNSVLLKKSVDAMKRMVLEMNGDIARLDEDKILLTPMNVKIVKRRKQ